MRQEVMLTPSICLLVFCGLSMAGCHETRKEQEEEPAQHRPAESAPDDSFAVALQLIEGQARATQRLTEALRSVRDKESAQRVAPRLEALSKEQKRLAKEVTERLASLSEPEQEELKAKLKKKLGRNIVGEAMKAMLLEMKRIAELGPEVHQIVLNCLRSE